MWLSNVRGQGKNGQGQLLVLPFLDVQDPVGQRSSLRSKLSASRAHSPKALCFGECRSENVYLLIQICSLTSFARGVATGGNAIEPTSDSRSERLDFVRSICVWRSGKALARRFKMYIDPPFGQGRVRCRRVLSHL